MFALLYDGEFVEEYDTIEEAIQRVREDNEDFLEDKRDNPQYYDEEDELAFDLYQIEQTIMKGEEIRNRVKNSS